MTSNNHIPDETRANQLFETLLSAADGLTGAGSHDGGGMQEFRTYLEDLRRLFTAQCETLAALEQDHKNQSARFGATLQALQVGVWIIDETGQILNKNEEADRIWRGEVPLVGVDEYPRYDARYLDSGKQLAPEDYPASRVLRTGRPVAPVELLIRRFDGSLGIVLGSAAPVFDQQGRLIGTVAMNVDITERKFSEMNAAFLSEVGHDFLHVMTPVEIVDTVAQKMIQYLGLTSRLSVLELEAGQDEFEVLYDYPLNGRASAMGRHCITSYISGNIMDDISAGRSVVFDDIAADERTAGRGEAFEPWQVRSIVLTPINIEENRIFLLAAQHAEPYAWQPHEISLLEDLTKAISRRLLNARVEEALRESEARFRIMADGIPNLIWVTDATDEVVFVNRAYMEFFDIQLEDVIRGGWQALVHPDDAPEYTERVGVSLRERIPFHAEARVLRKDGQWRWVESNALPRYSNTGEFLGMAGSSLDITERKVAETALVQSHEELVDQRNRLLAVMETLPVGVAICDAQGGVVQANRGYEEIWGQPRPFTSSVNDYYVYRAWDAESGEPLPPDGWAAARAVTKGETVTGQFLRIKRFDGTVGYVLNSAAPIRNARGDITGATVGIMDITTRVQVENALEESERSLKEIEERFRVAMTPAPMLVYTCDLNQRYTWVYNPLRGFRAEDMLGKRDDELLPYEAVKELVDAKQWALDSGQAGAREIHVEVGNETAYYILAMEPQRDSDGLVSGLTCSAIDITEQRQLAREREQRMRQIEMQRRLIENRDRERQEIAREIHDGPIQTLVSTIFELQFTRSAMEDKALQEEMELIGNRLKNAVDELREVVNELRPPSLLRFGFTRAMMMFANDFNDKHPEIRLTLDLNNHDTLIPEAVGMALFRIYQEALNNVYRHAQASAASVRLRIVDHSVMLEITDNGVGLQAGHDLTHQTETGHYGMAGMKERAEAAGGQFTMHSEPGKGTTIRVIIPVIEPASKENP